jgi:hypothetical protein
MQSRSSPTVIPRSHPQKTTKTTQMSWGRQAFRQITDAEDGQDVVKFTKHLADEVMKDETNEYFDDENYSIVDRSSTRRLPISIVRH